MFDAQAARAAGYSDAEIAAHLAASSKFDVAGAKKAGYSDAEIVGHLSGGVSARPSQADLMAEAAARVDAAKPQPAAAEPSLMDRAGDMFSGSLRRTAQTDALPDWAGMPELNTFSFRSALAGLGTMMTGPEETAKVIQANFPNTQVRKDDKGNLILRSSIDGQEYAIKPGFQVSDVPRLLGGILGGSAVGTAATIRGAALAGAGTQAVIEGTQAAAGGDFDVGPVAAAGALGAAIPAVARGVSAVRGSQPAAGPRIEPTMGSVADAATPSVQPTAMSADDLAATARSAALGGIGSKRATQDLAQQVAPDAETLAAAQRLGISEHLQPDHITTNQAFRQLAQLIKSQTGSEAAISQRQGLEKVAERASAVIDEIGGTPDLSSLSAGVRQRMMAAQGQADEMSEQLYRQLEHAIPKTAPAKAGNVLAFVEQRAQQLGGAQYLSALERNVMSRLKPESGQPTYALLDDVRKTVGAAARGRGVFKDEDTGLAKKLYGLLTDDQGAVAAQFGQQETFNAARQMIVVRKGIEDDLAGLFGKQLDGSMIPLLTGAVKKLGSGDSSGLAKLMRLVPDDMRQNVAASGLHSFFQRTARGGEMDFAGFARWHDGVQRNQQAYAALMSNLPKEVAQQLADIAKVSRGVAMSKGEFIATGKAINPKVLDAADGLMGRVYDEVRRRGVAGMAAEALGSIGGAPGLASALVSATTRNKPSIMKQADKLIASPEFLAAVRDGGAVQAGRLGSSKSFQSFVKTLGSPPEMSDGQRWILRAMQGADTAAVNAELPLTQ